MRLKTVAATISPGILGLYRPSQKSKSVGCIGVFILVQSRVRIRAKIRINFNVGRLEQSQNSLIMPQLKLFLLIKATV